MTAFLIPTNTTDTTQEFLTGTETGVVAPGALLAVTSGSAVVLTGTAPLLTVLGTVLTSASGAAAVGNSGAPPTSLTISVGQAGAIMAPLNTAIIQTISGNSFRLTNDGLISGNGAIRVSGSASTSQFANIFNNGTLTAISGAIEIDSTLENASIYNTGTISGGLGEGIQHGATGQLWVFNTGTILSQVTAVETQGSITLTNTGTLSGEVEYGNIAFIDNSGLIEGSVTDNDQITVAGIQGATVSNAGTITGDVRLGNGNDTFFDLGGSVGGRVHGGSGDDTFYVRNATLRIADSFGSIDRIFTTVDYRIAQGIEALFADTQVGLHLWGSVRAERIEGNAGNDTLEGLGGNDTLFGQTGDDQVFGGRGNDFLTGNGLNDTDDNQLFGGDGDDIVNWSGAGGILNGGAGRDVLNIASLINLAAVVDLQAGTASYVNTGTGAVAVAVTAAEFEDVTGTANNDRVDGSNGENTITGLAGNDSLNGRSGNDFIFGGDGNDTLLGGADNDQLYGGQDADSLSGSAGDDYLVGDTGRDTLNGGTGVDTFTFFAVGESIVGASDLIVGFDVALERISLNTIDADPVTVDNDGFAFIGLAAFTGISAQVRYLQAGGNQTIVQVRLAGDALTDMELTLSGLFALTADNFFL